MNPRRRDERFDQLLALAREGNEEAIADLFKEYQYEFPTTGKTDTHKQTEET